MSQHKLSKLGNVVQLMQMIDIHMVIICFDLHHHHINFNKIKPLIDRSFILVNLLRRITPLAGASMFKMSLLISELTCILGNAM